MHTKLKKKTKSSTSVSLETVGHWDPNFIVCQGLFVRGEYFASVQHLYFYHES